jgi:hypothetical protein
MIKNLINKIKGGLNMKNWSLKKKLTVGIAAIGTTLLGIFAYGKYNKELGAEEGYFEDEDFDEETEVNVEGFESETETE